MTTAEMMGCGVPTIVSRTTALPEATLGLCRYYEPSTDANALANALANAMLKELRSPTPQQELDAISRRVRQVYDHVAIARQYWGFLHGVST